jgi:hypothetical protein
MKLTAIELDRMKTKDTYMVSDALSGDVTSDESKTLASEVVEDLTRVFGLKEPTVSELLQDLYELTQAREMRDSETGKQISLIELQDLFYNRIDMLSGILGIELKD